MMRHHLHMPSYFLGTFTEYPLLSEIESADKRFFIYIELLKAFWDSLNLILFSNVL